MNPWQKKPQKFPLRPKHPERICWGCDQYCPANDLRCANGSGRTEHPYEILGEHWFTFGEWADVAPQAGETAPDPSCSSTL